jgi:hypothetical protein
MERKNRDELQRKEKEEEKVEKKPYIEPSYEKKSSLYRDTGQIYYYYYTYIY